MDFYKIKDNSITLSSKLTHNDVAFIFDGKTGYVWKGDNARDFNKLNVMKIEQMIKEKFGIIKLEPIHRLEILETDNLNVKEIKSKIIKKLESSSIIKLKAKQQSFLNKLNRTYNELRNYDKSIKLQKNLSNLTNLWKLSIFNVAILAIGILMVSNQSLINLYNGDILLFLSFICLLVVLIVNLSFVIWPLKFRVRFLSLEETKDTEVINKKKKTSTTQIESSFKKQDSTRDLNNYLSKDDLDLNIPIIPEKPKMRNAKTLDSSDISDDTLVDISKHQAQNKKVILVNCERCKKVIPVPIPENLVLTSDLPVVPLSYVHMNREKKDQHCITIYIDHDFDIRRQRISDVILS
ncbi:MAG: hypothetical protein ACFFDN_46790 [Candidatus Hodarchaeota archaeon]